MNVQVCFTLVDAQHYKRTITTGWSYGGFNEAYIVYYIPVRVHALCKTFVTYTFLD